MGKQTLGILTAERLVIAHAGRHWSGPGLGRDGRAWPL